MEYGDIYFRGFLFNQDVNDIEEAYEFAETILSDIPNVIDIYKKENITFIEDYKNIYFKTLTISKNADTVYKNIKYESDNKPHKNIFIFHFFNEVSGDNEHIKIYKHISNIENMIRLLISFSYYLVPNIEYTQKKDSFIEANLENYMNFFAKKEIRYTIENFAKNNDLKKEFNEVLDVRINEYKKIIDIVEAIKEITLNKDLNNVRVAVAHNKMLSGDKTNIIDYKYIDELEKLYKNLNDIFDSTLEKYQRIVEFSETGRPIDTTEETKIYNSLSPKEKSDFIFSHKCKNCLSSITEDEIIKCNLCLNNCCIHCTDDEGFCWNCNKKLNED